MENKKSYNDEQIKKLLSEENFTSFYIVLKSGKELPISKYDYIA